MTIDDDTPVGDIDRAGSDEQQRPRSDSLKGNSADGQNIDLLDSAPRVWRAYLRALGPGLVTGASDDDPSGIATYAQTGAQFGFSMLWVALITFPLMAGVQEICDRTALATGKGLGELLVVRFGRGWRLVIGFLIGALIIANTLNIAADLVAVGAGMHLVHAGPTALWAVLAGAIIMVLLITGSFAIIARVFKVLCAALLAYLVELCFIKIPWGTVIFNTVVPHIQFNRTYVALLVGVLGTTISPYLFFWQSMHRIEEMREEDAGGTRPMPLRRRSRIDAAGKESRSRFDVFSGMAFSNVVMFAIIVVTAITLAPKSGHHLVISSPAQVAAALRPVAGRFASIIFALGFIGSGMLAIPVLAGAGSAGMAGLLGKQTGFSNSPRRAPVFYGLCAVGTVGGMALSLLSVNPITLLVFVAVVNGVAAAPFIVVTMFVSSNRTIMGEYVNGKAAKTLGWLTAILMGVAAVALFATGGV
jgi:NRAMP (natural resistance-associated macrophage protein)-like metal ion transporter